MSPAALFLYFYGFVGVLAGVYTGASVFLVVDFPTLLLSDLVTLIGRSIF